ncbi:hypothetical protein [Actinoplanes sp. KI2]|uniref:hypothetical protein n=1 Tax=Actinoplanes sp. KI2 TaxID=2983315 RepID=UPI0039833441
MIRRGLERPRADRRGKDVGLIRDRLGTDHRLDDLGVDRLVLEGHDGRLLEGHALGRRLDQLHVDRLVPGHLRVNRVVVGHLGVDRLVLGHFGVDRLGVDGLVLGHLGVDRLGVDRLGVDGLVLGHLGVDRFGLDRLGVGLLDPGRGDDRLGAGSGHEPVLLQRRPADRRRVVGDRLGLRLDRRLRLGFVGNRLDRHR